MDVSKGDRVLVGKYSGSEIKINEDDFVILREDEILAVVNDKK
jgi:chaperonin GroES